MEKSPSQPFKDFGNILNKCAILSMSELLNHTYLLCSHPNFFFINFFHISKRIERVVLPMSFYQKKISVILPE